MFLAAGSITGFWISIPSIHTYPVRLIQASTRVAPLEQFITILCEQSNVQTPTLMSTLVYLERLKARLPKVAKGMQYTCHRIFLTTLILSAKYQNDSSPKNKHWAGYVMGLFMLPEVNLMEKQLLFLLDWDLRIMPEDLYTDVLPYFLQRHAARQLQVT